MAGKVAPVTGANPGIARAIAAEFTSEGMYIWRVPGGAAMALLADTRIKIANNAARVFSTGRSDSAAPGKAIAEAVGYFGRLDLMPGDPGR